MERKRLTLSQENYIKENYLKIPIKILATKMGFSATLIKSRLITWDLTIPESVRIERKQNSYFSRGHKPFNKGKKISDYLDESAQEKLAQTQFKKGVKPHNTIGPNELRLRTDSKGFKYWYFKIKDSKWVLYHRYLFENAYGEIPKNRIVVFKDKNPNNITLDNLELVSRGENLKRNQDNYHTYPSHIKPVLSLTYKLNDKIKHHETK